MEGTRIGAYQVEAELGSGAMGTVHRARVVGETPGLDDGQQVAIKLLHPHLLAQPGFFKRFMREAEVGRQVDHENVVRTFDVDALEVEGKTAHFLVMEYVEGRTLRAMLHDLGTVPEALLREIARQVAAGLSAIHDAGVVHRDLKPENILVTDDHQVRIMDLGVARLVEESVALTRKGEFAGSLLYAAPEQFRNEEVGPLSDLYSLGVLLYELATGANPFRRDAAAQVISAHLEDMPRTATEVGAELSPYFSEVLTTLLAKRPEGRFDSAEALREVLEQGERSSWWAERERELLKARGHLPKVPVRRETELYGRETELQVLREAWSRAHQDQGNTILLEGEAGIGKTRLVDTFLKELEGQEVHVLYGSYPPSGGMGGLSDAITDHFGLRSLEDALKPYLTVTPSLVPAFAALVKHESPPTGSEPIQGDALHAVMVHLMRGLAEERPLVWVVDDLHFSDPDSRKIVLSLARAVEGHRVLLLTTSRPGLPKDEVAHFSRLENFRRVDLGRISPREVIQLLRDAFKSEMLADKLGAKIAYKSDGVPFFVFEMIRGLREGRLIKALPDGTWVETQVIEEIEVPSAVKDLIEARLRDLPDEDRSLLDVCAVQGFEFNPKLTAAVREMKPVAVLERLAAIERRSGVIRAAGRHFRFDHHQIQEVLDQSIAEGLKEEYHTLLAEAHEARLEGEPTGEDAVFLASHHLHGSKLEGALPCLLPALEHMERSYRNNAVIELANRALATPGLLTGRERVKVLLRLIACLALIGRLDEEDAALDEALEVAEKVGDAPLRARVKLARGWRLNRIGQWNAAHDCLGDALALAKKAQDKSLEGDAEGKLGNICWYSGRFKDAQAHFERRLVLARQTADVRSEASALFGLAVIAQLGGHWEESVAHYDKDLSIVRHTRDRKGEAICLVNMGSLSAERGRFGEATQYCEQGLKAAREVGDRRVEGLATGNLGGGLIIYGQYEEARSLTLRWQAMTREIGHLRQKGLATYQLALIDDHEGNENQAIHLYEECLALQRRTGEKDQIAKTLVSLARIETRRGEAKQASERLHEALELARATKTPNSIVLTTVEQARLPGGSVQSALAAMHDYENRVEHTYNMEARFRLWDLTSDPAHLQEAHLLLCYLRDHAPEEYRESMITNVPLHRDIMAAWEEHGGENE